jgi:hypothetical protein
LPTSPLLFNITIDDVLTGSANRATKVAITPKYNNPRNLDNNLLVWKRNMSHAKTEEKAIHSRI